MKRFEVVLATTHVDKHSSRMTKESLEQAAAASVGKYIPMLEEHDWLRPIGRIAPGGVRQREDGEWEFVGTAEILEPGDRDVPADPGREFRVSPPEELGVSVQVGDEFVRDPDSKAAVTAMEEVLNKPVGLLGRRAAAPPDLVQITMLAALGFVAQGFLSEMGAAGYRRLKSAVMQTFKSRAGKAAGQRLCVDLYFEQNGVEVMLIQADPEEHDVDRLLSKGLEQLDEYLPEIVRDMPDLRRIVCEYGKDGLQVRYGVGPDCLPRALQRRAK